MPIFTVARVMPIVLTNNCIRSFWAAKTCSTRERIFDLAALARRVASGMGLPLGFLRWTFAQAHALVSGGVSRRPLADEAEATVDRDVVLIAEDRNGQIDRRGRAVLFRFGLGELHRPAGIAVLRAEFGRLVLPILRDAAFLDCLLLFLRIALLGRGDQTGVDDLPRHGDVAGCAQRRVETVE
jgi:hypothetical protein